VRKQAKSHGARQRIEGPWQCGLQVAVVDDTLTTGRSALDAASAIVEAGGTVTGVWSLIDREEGARDAIQAAGYSYEGLFTAREILE